MKIVILFFRTLALIVMVAACSFNDNMDTIIEEGENKTPNPRNGKIIIAHFSYAGNTEFPTGVDTLSTANLIIGESGAQGITEAAVDFVRNIIGVNKSSLFRQSIPVRRIMICLPVRTIWNKRRSICLL